MGNFNTRRPFSGGQNDYKQMHKAICSNCNKPCEVPFKPNGSKPVLCRDCFRNSNSPFEGGGRTESRSFEKRPYENRSEFRAPNAPQMPNYTEQFSSLSAKLDKVISLLVAQEAKSPKVVKEVAKVVEEITEEVNHPVIVEEKKKTVKKKSPAKKK